MFPLCRTPWPELRKMFMYKIAEVIHFSCLEYCPWFAQANIGFNRIEPGFSANPLGQLGRTSFFAE